MTGLGRIIRPVKLVVVAQPAASLRPIDAQERGYSMVYLDVDF